MSGYAKLFSEIVDSSIWDEDSDTCKVWITLLALADQDGYVRGSDGWLAGKSRVSLGKCTLALRKFKEPDVRSRTPDNEGRRIEQLEDGWLILNYIAFRDRLSADPKAVATRERVRKHRERYNALRNAESVTSAVPASASVVVHASVPQDRKGCGEGKDLKDRALNQARVIIHYLNEQARRCYRETEQNFKLILARLHEVDGDVEGIKQMIGRQVALWRGDAQMEQYLRPETLFGKQKFGSYYDNRNIPVSTSREPEKNQIRETIQVRSL